MTVREEVPVRIDRYVVGAGRDAVTVRWACGSWLVCAEHATLLSGPPGAVDPGTENGVRDALGAAASLSDLLREHHTATDRTLNAIDAWCGRVQVSS